MAPELSHAGQQRIVIGDDSPEMLASATRILREAGYAVFATYNGYSTAQVAAFIADLDLLITNTRLVDMTAAQLIPGVRRHKPHLPILHIGEPLPADDPVLASIPTLSEPFTASELRQAVENLLQAGH
jgi:DNA-binding NtrC family response regulator